MQYIYIRQHPSYKLHNAVKLGKTTDLVNRDSTYSTGEIIRGVFYPVYEILSSNINIVEKQLQQEFKSLQIRKNAGTEFFNENKPTSLLYEIIDDSLNYDEITILCNSNNIKFIKKYFSYDKTIIIY